MVVASDVHLPRSAELVPEEPLVAAGVGAVIVLVLLKSQPEDTTSAARPTSTVVRNRVVMVEYFLDVRGFCGAGNPVQDSIGPDQAEQQCP